jgi:hypothetical protein
MTLRRARWLLAGIHIDTAQYRKVAHNQLCRRRLRSAAFQMKHNYSNIAQLKDLMTVPPMTAAQHAQVLRKRIAQRRMVEEARDLKKASADQFDKF